MVRLLAITLLLVSSSSLASDILTAVPERFVGTWAGSPEACGSDADDLTLRLQSGHISYWESDGPIKAIVVRGSDEIAMIAELSGEGEIWLATPQFRLTPEGDRLIDESTVPGEELVRYRCSSPTGSRSNNSFKPNLLRKSA